MKKETNKDKMIRVIQQLRNIEKWKGDAYSQDDEVDQAMTEIKMIALNTLYGYPEEMCPHCDTVSTINRPFSNCPKCGKILVACSMCEIPRLSGEAGSCKGCCEGSKMRIDIDFNIEDDFRLPGGGEITKKV